MIAGNSTLEQKKDARVTGHSIMLTSCVLARWKGFAMPIIYEREGLIQDPKQGNFFDIQLSRNIRYSVLVEPQDRGVDFDLEVWDLNGNLIAADQSLHRDAVCEFTPRRTEVFRLVVKSKKGGSWFHIAVEEQE